MKKVILAVLAFAVFAAASGAPLSAAEPDTRKAQEVIRAGITQAAKILRSHDLPRHEINDRLRTRFRESFDVPTIARFALGVHSRRISERQFEMYLAAFEDVIVETFTNRIFVYGPRMQGDISDILEITGAVPVGSRDVFVRTRINREKAKWVKIDWRMRERDGEPKIIDVIILGISQAQLYRQEFASVIRRRDDGIDGLIAALREKSAKLRSK